MEEVISLWAGRVVLGLGALCLFVETVFAIINQIYKRGKHAAPFLAYLRNKNKERREAREASKGGATDGD
jgi:hypothetical protein